MQLVSFVTVKRQSHGDGLIQIKEPNRPMCSSKIIPRGRILLGPNFKAAEFGGLSICSKSAQTAASGSSKNYSEAHPPDVRGQITCRAIISWFANLTTRTTIRPDGMQLPSHDAAKDHGNCIVRELKDGGYCPGNAALVIHHETGRTVHSIPF